MTREEAIWYLQPIADSASLPRYAEALNMAISALREQENKRYNTHEVACIIAELFGDDCACNFNNIDEWLPDKCDLQDACPNTVGVACWEQYLKHRECGRRLEEV